MKRITALASSALFAFAVLTGCSVKDGSGDQNAKGKKEITFLVFETPNLTARVWDAAIKRVTDKYPDITVKKLVAPTPGPHRRTPSSCCTSGQFPDVMIAVSPAGFAEAGNLYAWTAGRAEGLRRPRSNGADQRARSTSCRPTRRPSRSSTTTRSMFAEAGITAPPKTYAELLDAAAKLKAKGITPFVIGGGKDDVASALTAGRHRRHRRLRQEPGLAARSAAPAQVKFADPDFVKAAGEVRRPGRSKGYIDKRDALPRLRRHRAGVPATARARCTRWATGSPRRPTTRRQAGLRGRRVHLALRRRQAGRARLHRRRPAGQRQGQEPRRGQEVRAGLPARQGPTSTPRSRPTGCSRPSRATRPPADVGAGVQGRLRPLRSRPCTQNAVVPPSASRPATTGCCRAWATSRRSRSRT